MLDNTPNQPSKFKAKNWVEINDDSRGTYNTDSQIKFKISMLKSNVCNYSDAYILLSKKITITGAGNDTAARQVDERNKEVKFKNCAQFTDCISEINNTQVDNAKDLGVLMPMYNSIKYIDNYPKTSGSLWQYHRDKPAIDNNGNIVNFSGDSASSKFKVKLTRQILLQVIQKMLK